MTTEERLEKLKRELTAPKRLSRPLIVLGVLLMGLAFSTFLVALFGNHALQQAWEQGYMFLVVAGGIVCIILGCIPNSVRLLSLGIVLVGVATAIALWSVELPRSFRPEYHGSTDYRATARVVLGFVIGVTGLSGLACAALGLARLLAKAAKPTTSETPKQPPKEHPGAALYRELRDANDGQVPVVPLEIFPRSTSPEKSPPKKP